MKDRRLRRDPTVAIQSVDPGNAYRWMTISGTADEMIEEDDPERGHLATESTDELGRTSVERYPSPSGSRGRSGCSTPSARPRW